MNQLNDTELSAPHKHVLKMLREYKVNVVSEYPVTVKGITYKLDCFLPDYLVAVEIDGPYHRKKRDKVRDSLMWGLGVVTLRVSADVGKMDLAVLAGLEESLPERREKWAKRKEQE